MPRLVSTTVGVAQQQLGGQLLHHFCTRTRCMPTGVAVCFLAGWLLPLVLFEHLSDECSCAG